MAYEQLIVDLDGAVATVTMSNAEKLNALSPTLTMELSQELERLGKDQSVRAIVLTGEGRGFSAGADLGSLQDPYLKGERPKLSSFLKEGYNRLIPLLTEAPKPVIAAVNGIVAGAGMALMLAADIRIASDEARFGAAFVNIGLIPDSGSCYLLPRTIGMASALELAITGERIDAAGAMRLGLVNRVVPHDQLPAEAHSLAVRLSQMPTTAIALTKRIFREASMLTLEETLDREAEVQDEAAATDDHVEGVLAFLQKREPSFSGR
jgi:2-(1,2-epoxy-1,2-dihydrophenyl)acetyl-CoA isomerase